MDTVNFAVSALFCALVGQFLLPPWLCFLPAAFFAGYEIAEAKTRYLEKYAGKKPKYRCEFGWMSREAWTFTQLSYVIVPMLVSVFFYFVASHHLPPGRATADDLKAGMDEILLARPGCIESAVLVRLKGMFDFDHNSH